MIKCERILSLSYTDAPLRCGKKASFLIEYRVDKNRYNWNACIQHAKEVEINNGPGEVAVTTINHKLMVMK